MCTESLKFQDADEEDEDEEDEEEEADDDREVERRRKVCFLAKWCISVGSQSLNALLAPETRS